MNTQTFKTRILESRDPLLVRKNKTFTAKFFKTLPSLRALANGNAVHPRRWSKANGHYRLSGESETVTLCSVLRTAGIDYEMGNDAPRGGLEGLFVKLTSKGLNQMKNINLSDL